MTALPQPTAVAVEFQWLGEAAPMRFNTFAAVAGMAAAFIWECSAARADAGATLRRLDFKPNAISGDGTVVVGWRDRQAVRWTGSTGTSELGYLPGHDESWAAAVSADGSVVVGTSAFGHAEGTFGERAFRWTAGTGMEDLGLPQGGAFGHATGVSADGSVVVGRAGIPLGREHRLDAFRWTQAGGMLSGFGAPTDVGVSADGSVMVVWPQAGSFPTLIRWTSDTEWQSVDVNIELAIPSAVSADGSVVVGRAGFNPLPEAFRWELATGAVGLGFSRLEISNHSDATAVSADGSAVVGVSSGSSVGNTDYGSEAFIWDRTSGMRPLRAVLEEAGVDTTAFRLNYVTGVSWDGRTIVGFGGDWSDGWVATIPEPGGLAVLSVLVAAGLATRMRRAR